jgi:hypothetical protein
MQLSTFRHSQKHSQKRLHQHRELIRREAAIGGQLFGPVASNMRREFVCLNKNTWLWHEEWSDSGNIWHSHTTLYDVREYGIFKMQDDGTYILVSRQEAEHLHAAALLYHERVRTALYNI